MYGNKKIGGFIRRLILAAMRQGKEDAMVDPDIIIRYMMIDNEDLTYLKEDPQAEHPNMVKAIIRES